MKGLPDYDIVGSGDLHFAFSLLNRVSNALERDLNPSFKRMILENSSRVYRTLESISQSESKQIVGYAPLLIRHNWHGSQKDRQYVDRWKILISHKFNYETDVMRNSDGLFLLISQEDRNDRREGGSEQGCSFWTCCTSSGEDFSLEEDIQTHFESRNEDEMVCILEDNCGASVRGGKDSGSSSCSRNSSVHSHGGGHDHDSDNCHGNSDHHHGYSVHYHDHNGTIECTSQY